MTELHSVVKGMDKRVVSPEESQKISDYAACSSNSSESLIHIESIVTDLTGAMEDTESPTHDHFSIRGMDKPIVSPEESQKRSDFVACASNSSESLICNTDSIVMDLTGTTEDTESPAHDNFSIRCSGFAARVRERFRSTRLPFVNPEDIDGNTMGNYLPPNMSTERTQESMVVAARNSDVVDRTQESMSVTARSSDAVTGYCNNVNNERDILRLCSKKNKGTKDKTNLGDKDHETPCINIQEANQPLVSNDRHNNSTTDVDDVADILMSLRGTIDQCNASSRSDGTKSALSPRRKPNLRMRSLVDIIEETRNINNNNIYRTRFSSTRMLAKGARSPPKKRTITFDEGRGSLDKRINEVALGAERTRKRAGTTSKPKLDMIKPKRHKAPEIGKRLREFPRMNNAHTQKHVIPYEGNFSNVRSKSRVDSDKSMPLPPSRSFEGDFNSRGKMTFDASLNGVVGNCDDQASSLGQHRTIPDLNETFINETGTGEENQLSILSERIFPLSTTLDASTSPSSPCTRESISEGKRPMFINDLPHNRSANIELGGPSNDTPMEIVDLSARNGRERELENSSAHPFTSSSGGASRLYSLGRSPRTINISRPSRRSWGMTITNRNMGNIQQQHSAINCPVPSNKPQQQESSFNLFTTSQHRDLPFDLNIPQSQPMQTNSAPAVHHPKGKTVTDIRHSEGKNKGIIIHGGPVLNKDGDVRSSSTTTSVGALDPYNTRTIPAMQLLSLMDRGIVSGSSFDVGPSNGFLDEFGSFFAHNRNSFGTLSRLGFGAHCEGESSKKAQVRIEGQMHNDEGPNDLVTEQEESHLALGDCTLNQNPADFSVPDASNEYTISAKDLEPEERTKKPDSMNLEGKKK